MTAETIFLARPNRETAFLYPGHAAWYKNARPVFEKYHNVVDLDLPDIWVRDFLPLQNRTTGKLYQMFYNPIFRTELYKKSYAEIRDRVKKLFPNAEPLPVRMDGGNLITNGAMGMAFWNNMIGESKDNVAKILKDALGFAEFHWLPKLPGHLDAFCHIDGFANFINDRTIITSLSANDERHDSRMKLYDQKLKNSTLRTTILRNIANGTTTP